jgi:putative transposase
MSPRQSFIESLPMARRLVRRDGITLHLIRYWSDMLTAWIGNP